MLGTGQQQQQRRGTRITTPFGPLDGSWLAPAGTSSPPPGTPQRPSPGEGPAGGRAGRQRRRSSEGRGARRRDGGCDRQSRRRPVTYRPAPTFSVPDGGHSQPAARGRSPGAPAARRGVTAGDCRTEASPPGREEAEAPP